MNNRLEPAAPAIPDSPVLPPAAPPASRPMTAAEWSMLGLLSVLWGGSFMFQGVAVRELPVFTIVAVRVLLAAITLHVVLVATGRRFPTEPKVLLAFAGMGLLNNIIPFNLIVFGQGYVTSGLASILNATTPIFTMLIVHAFTADEKLGPRKIAGVLSGFAGVVILFSERDLLAGSALIGQLACIGASISYGFSGLYGRRFARMGIEPVMIATGQVTFAALVMVPVALLVNDPLALPMPSLATVLAILALAVVSTAGAYILFFRVLTRAGATNAALVTLMVPCTAMILGALVLGESIGLRQVLGFLVIALGLLVIDGRVLGFLREKVHG